MGFLQEWLINPVVQGAVLPLVVGLLACVILAPLRLGGLAVVAGFATAVYLVAGFEFSPLTTVRKLVLVGLALPVLGVVVDLAFRPTPLANPIIAAISGKLSIWVFFTLLSQKTLADALLWGAGTGLFVAWQVAATVSLRDDSVRAGAAGLALGVGTGVAAVFSASATLGLYAMAFGSASGAFLLVQMVRGRRVSAGFSLTLAAGLLAGLVGVAALYLAQMPWYALAVLALVPLAVRVPVPSGWPVWGQAVAVSTAALAVGGAACYLVWASGHGLPT